MKKLCKMLSLVAVAGLMAVGTANAMYAPGGGAGDKVYVCFPGGKDATICTVKPNPEDLCYDVVDEDIIDKGPGQVGKACKLKGVAGFSCNAAGKVIACFDDKGRQTTKCPPGVKIGANCPTINKPEQTEPADPKSAVGVPSPKGPVPSPFSFR